MLFFLIAGCAPADTGRPHFGSDDSAVDDSAADDSGGSGDCPAGAVLVGSLCIDAWETTVTGDVGNADQGANFPDGSTTATATALSGVQPSVQVTWYQAFAVCQESGRHLCTVDEWQEACGAGRYPWGETPEPVDVCVVTNADGSTEWRGTEPTGSLPECVSPDGVYDQMGNAWEWADPGATTEDGLPATAKLGGAWYAGGADAACGQDAHDEHPPTFEGTIGFRCCGESG